MIKNAKFQDNLQVELARLRESVEFHAETGQYLAALITGHEWEILKSLFESCQVNPRFETDSDQEVKRILSDKVLSLKVSIEKVSDSASGVEDLTTEYDPKGDRIAENRLQTIVRLETYARTIDEFIEEYYSKVDLAGEING